MIELLLKASFAIGMALLFYKLLLQQESFFAINRIYLLGCIALAFALPYITLPKLVSQQGLLTEVFQQKSADNPVAVTAVAGGTHLGAYEEEQPVVATQQLPPVLEAASPAPAAQPEKSGYSLVFWLSMLYLFGVAVFTFNLLFQLASLLHKILTATDKVADGKVVLITTAARQSPCSFFQYIFIYPNDYDLETYEQIVEHEKMHARLGHSLDLLFAELAVIVIWFNPLIWLLKKEIEKNIEYQTDAILLDNKKLAKEKYQLNLLQIAVPDKPLRITANYNQSLLKQRILMMNAKRSNLSACWKYAFMLPLFFGLLLLLNAPATSQDALVTASVPAPPPPVPDVPLVPAEAPAPKTSPAPAAASEEVPVGNSLMQQYEQRKLQERVQPQELPDNALPAAHAAPKPRELNLTTRSAQTDMSEGVWYSQEKGDSYCIQFSGNSGSGTWNRSRCYPKTAFRMQSQEVFVLTNDAGTLQLSGNLAAAVGQGSYVFTEDNAFKNYLAENDIFSRDRNLLFHLFIGDVDKSYVEFLKKQYGQVSGERLLELAIHGVNQKNFISYVSLFQKYGNKIPSIAEVVEARIHGIDEAYVQDLHQAGFQEAGMQKMLEAIIHGVNTAYVESLRNAGFRETSLSKVIEAKRRGIQPATISSMQALGFGELSLDKIIELKLHSINAAYVNSLKAAGLENLTIDQVIEARIHGLTSATVAEIRAIGLKNLSFRDLISARIHTINKAFVAELREAGFDNLSMNKLVEARIHKVNGAFIRQVRQNGYNLSSFDKYISLKIHGMAMESLKEK